MLTLFDRISGLVFKITFYKNQHGTVWKHLASDGSGWKDFKYKDGKIKRTIIKGRHYNDVKNTIKRVMARSRITGLG